MYEDETMIDRRSVLCGGLMGAAAITLPKIALGSVDAVSVAQRINDIELTASMITQAQVELRRKGAKTRKRSLEMAQMRQGSTALSLRRYAFLAPADISGTKLLVREKPSKVNDLWLLLPSVGKPRRISASKQSNSFAGTDFSYADLMAIKIDMFAHQIVGSNSKTIVLESQTKSTSYAKEIGYARSVVTASAKTFVPSQVEYFDRKGRLFKTQKLSGAKRTPDGQYIIRKRKMIVHGQGNETTIQLGQLNFKSGLGRSDFKSQRL